MKAEILLQIDFPDNHIEINVKTSKRYLETYYKLARKLLFRKNK